jgi:ABC-2 type transport system ATP-binding protein
MIIQTSKLTKTFKLFEKEAGLRGSIKSLFNRKFTYKTALSDFNLTVDEGEFVGLIGPNGAGKTTLVKMLTGIIAPTSGDISALGFYPNKLENAFKKQYAIVMGQKSQLFFDLSAGDTFLLFKELYEIPADEFKKSLDYFVKLFDVEKLLNVQVRTLSLGERMKMELIVALLHNPKVLFLDEPTIGLDAVAQKQIRSFLKDINENKGTTIILTSHYMEDIKSLCKRCVVVNSGEKIYDGSTYSLFEKYRTHKKISLSFTEETEFVLPDRCMLVEQNSLKVIFMVPIENSQDVVNSAMKKYILSDISIEEDEIGNVVERIYSDSGNAMKKYIEVAKILFKAQIAYRFDVAMTVIFTISKMLFAYILWGAVFGQNKTVAGFTFPMMLSYYIISSFLSQIEMSEGVSGEISSRIRGGTFSKYMVIPANTQGYFIAQTFGAMAFYLFFIFAASVLWVFLFGVEFIITNKISLILATVLMVILGLVFMIQLNYFLGILAFKFQDVGVFLMIKGNIVSFVTGALVPLALLPHGIVSVMRFFPFYYVTYLPSMLLIGKNGNEILTGIVTLSVWLLAFILLNRFAYNKMRVIYDGVGI